MRILLHVLYALSFSACMVFGHFVGISHARKKHDGDRSLGLHLMHMASLATRMILAVWYFVLTPWYVSPLLGIAGMALSMALEGRMHGLTVLDSSSEHRIERTGLWGWPLVTLLALLLVFRLHGHR